jgi:hypothetical protein
MIFMGLFPGTVLRKMDASVARYIESLKAQAPVATALALPGQTGLEASTLTEPER